MNNYQKGKFMQPRIFWNYPSDKEIEKTQKEFGAIALRLSPAKEVESNRPIWVATPVYAGESFSGYVNAESFNALVSI